ncbi:phospholipid-transporting ATPase ABCA1-like [Hippocampus zosterae]|uniref:phospholipid-transporting ATPase ABCA1-like n=1 Tax=Hippocampus zosterae TaxID=109293 RepID=UPI00223D2B28|nr:phospholipid-transporting ATPase ABCA1-like [Hippocampus zosterae]
MALPQALYVLLWKKITHCKRNKIGLCFELSWPLIIVGFFTLTLPKDRYRSDDTTGSSTPPRIQVFSTNISNPYLNEVGNVNNSVLWGYNPGTDTESDTEDRQPQEMPMRMRLLHPIILPFAMALAWIYPVMRTIRDVVFEKESRMKETMKLMGLSSGTLWLSWFITSLVPSLVSIVPLAALLKWGRIVKFTSLGVLIFFLVAFSTANIMLCFLMSTFFSKANLATVCGGLIYLSLHIPPLLSLTLKTTTKAATIFASFLSPAAFGFACQCFYPSESQGIGIQWNNIGSSVSEKVSLNFGIFIMMFFVDAFVYAAAAWYIDAVFPGQYGLPLPWNFLFDINYWKGIQVVKSRQIPVAPMEENKDYAQHHEEILDFDLVVGSLARKDLIEADPSNLVLGVSINNLVKIYKKGAVRAVDHLNLKFYEGQITSFLGHNGAGKTTTISVMTGMVPPTSGTVYINGMDVCYHLNIIRKTLGICPQDNVLFDFLTVGEHLWFYGCLRGRPKDEVRLECDSWLQEVGLLCKRHELVKNLSGGMKRKLLVILAFVGGSKVVVLDEPTAGVDPFSRRSIWDLLLKYREGRTIILSTHYMDEAELLSDRIAIISQGKLCCCGSPLFLKSKLGTGYTLTVVKKDSDSSGDRDAPRQGHSLDIVANSSPMEALLALAQCHFPSASLVMESLREAVISIPQEASMNNRLADFLSELDQNLSQIGIITYGLSDTKLEDIFLRVVEETELESELHADPPHQSTEQNDEFQEKHLLSGFGQRGTLTGWSMTCQHLRALFIKRWLYARRNTKSFFAQIVLPAGLLMGFLAIPGKNNSLPTDQVELLLTEEIQIAFILIVAISCVPSGSVLFLVEERASKATHLQFVSGLQPFLYWLTNICWDMLNYAVTAFLMVLILITFKKEVYTSDGILRALILLLLFYGWSVIPMMYPATFVFSDSITAYIFFSCVNLFSGIICGGATYFQIMSHTKAPPHWTWHILFILPHYSLGKGLVDMQIQPQITNSTMDPLEWNIVGKNLFAMAVQGVSFFIITLILQYIFFNGHWSFQDTCRGLSCIRPSCVGPKILPLAPEDEDVIRERERVKSGNADSDLITMIDLTKIYKAGGNPAVDQLCLGIPSGECFGLLGVNGAGKTSTFRMLTGDLSITYGEAFLQNHSVIREMDRVYQLMGYCPQFDAIFKLLTGTENLELHARLRGVPEESVTQVALWCLNKVGLSQYAKQEAGNYSGGNKRKLSTAIALIGAPLVLFLDEPTSGMDAKAKRFMWDCFRNFTKKGRAVVLTSHSMEECEAVCSRMAIMVNGTFRCLGSVQHLKNRFGEGYTIVLRLAESESTPDMCPVNSYMKNCFPMIDLKECHQTVLTYQLPMHACSLAKIFKVLANHEALGISAFSVSQTNMDQVFINFAMEQSDAEGPTNMIVNNETQQTNLTTQPSQMARARIPHETPNPLPQRTIASGSRSKKARKASKSQFKVM